MSFSGPTPKNAMQELKLGYGYAECGVCGYRHKIQDDLTPHNPVFDKSPDGHLVHRCDPEPYNYPKNQRGRARLRIESFTAMAEIERWVRILRNTKLAFPPDSEAETVMTELEASASRLTDKLRGIINNDQEPLQ